MITHERKGPSATVTMVRPAKHNAVTVEMWMGLRDLFVSLSTDNSIRIVILRGAGGRAFSVGADIAEFDQARRGSEAAAIYEDVEQAAITAVRDCCHPTIAAVQGFCVGGGLELATACDLRIATTSSRFGIPVNKLGLAVTYAELKSMVRLIGPANALELLYEGSLITADQALQKGLINRVVDDAQFDEYLEAMVERIASGAPLVARMHKRMSRRITDPRPVNDADRQELLALFDTEDYRIGARAFLDKRSPAFLGR